MHDRQEETRLKEESGKLSVLAALTMTALMGSWRCRRDVAYPCEPGAMFRRRPTSPRLETCPAGVCTPAQTLTKTYSSFMRTKACSRHDGTD